MRRIAVVTSVGGLGNLPLLLAAVGEVFGLVRAVWNNAVISMEEDLRLVRLECVVRQFRLF